MTTLTVGLSRQTAGMNRFARPVKHGADWISPFIAEPHDVTSPDFKKITIADKSGRVKERYFKIIDTTHFQDPITLEPDWPTDDTDVTRDMRILSCCHTAIKVDSLIQTFATKYQCPCCRKEGFINELGDSIPAPPIVPFPVHMTGAPPAVGILNGLLDRIGTCSLIIGACTWITTLALIILTPTSKSFYLPLGISCILISTGNLLIDLSRLRPHTPFNVKIRNIAGPLILRAFSNGAATFLLSIVKYSLLTSVFASTGAAITTIALAVLCARFMR